MLRVGLWIVVALPAMAIAAMRTKKKKSKNHHQKNAQTGPHPYPPVYLRPFLSLFYFADLHAESFFPLSPPAPFVFRPQVGWMG
jgi:hypothetical protein